MTVLMFMERFAPKVQAGTKRQTIRPSGGRTYHVGQRLSLRKWSGKAYRSPQVVLAEVFCTGWCRLTITVDGIITPRGPIVGKELYDFARADGFDSWDDMRDWFTATHSLPFFGQLIEWKP